MSSALCRSARHRGRVSHSLCFKVVPSPSGPNFKPPPPPHTHIFLVQFISSITFWRTPGESVDIGRRERWAGLKPTSGSCAAVSIQSTSHESSQQTSHHQQHRRGCSQSQNGVPTYLTPLREDRRKESGVKSQQRPGRSQRWAGKYADLLCLAESYHHSYWT